MVDMAKISVLVAVYNSEKYLHQCLDSLINQTFDDIEIICINDASTDCSLNILQTYAKKDNRIKVLEMPLNSGSAKARNAGLKLATGDFIAFVDSDDWVSNDAFEHIYNTFISFPKTDSVLFHVKNVFSNGQEKSYFMDDFDYLDGYTSFIRSLTWKIHGVYAVRKTIHLQFPYDESAMSYSDDNTTRLHYLNSREVRMCNAIYYYRQHKTSVTHRISLRRFDYLLANKSMKQQLEKLKVSKLILDLYEEVRWRNLIGLYMFYFLHRKELPFEERKQGLHLLKQTWKSIESYRLPKHLRYKLGYIPLKKSWTFFRLQEELYFFLRALLGRNKEE